MTKTIIDFFPTNEHIKGPRSNQRSVLQAIQKAFEDGYKNVLLEAPVGSGKSAVAVTCAKYYGSSHILTPRKSLQDQYMEDFFEEDIALMKGRGAYPCTWNSSKNKGVYAQTVKVIKEGRPIQILPGQRTCDKGECKNDGKAYMDCTGDEWTPGGELIPGDTPCPYNVALGQAQSSRAVVHNLHSFIFQTYFANRFDERAIIVIDECHEIEGIVRGFAEVKFRLPVVVEEEEIPTREDCATLEDWGRWFERFADKFSDRERVDGTTEREDFLDTIAKMVLFSESFGEEFVMDWEHGEDGRSTRFVFIPKNIGHLVEKYLLSYGKKRLLMSGTIYNKKLFCQKNGLKEDETCFMRIGSTFPLETRPIYFKKDYQVDTSHKNWDLNFSDMVEKIEKIMNVFDDVKGLIHTPSYIASSTLYNALRHTGRVLMHTKDDFGMKLEEFYEHPKPKVFLSPICQQGVDFKYDRARFQIILRVPYANTTDPFVEYLVKEDFPSYNYQALVIFGQQIGRVNRAEDDFGATILMDERFGQFLQRNRNVLPKWLMDAISYK